jgi:hypothetical protein
MLERRQYESFIAMRVQNVQRVHEVLPFKKLKELKMAVVQYGAITPFTLETIVILVHEPL